MEQPDLLDLRDYLQVLRQQAPLVAVITVTVTAVAVVAALLQTPQYEARADLILERVGTTQDISLSELLNPVGIVGDAEMATAESLAVAERAAATLGRGDVPSLRSQVTVSVVDDTQRLRFRAVSTDPEAAARTADAFATAFVEHRRDAAVAAIERLRTELDDRSLQLREQIDVVDRELAALGPEAVDDDTTTSADRETLQLRRQALQSQQSQTILRSTQLDGIADADALTGFDTAFIPASVPTDPMGGGVGRTAVLAIVLGLMLGVGAAFLKDHVDDGVHSEHDLGRAADGLPVLGRIPTWDAPAATTSTRLVSMVEPASHTAEAYRELSANVRFLLAARAGSERDTEHIGGSGGGRAILVGSANIGEGKTATAANLAVATARVGLRTILVDADLRRSAVARRFGIPRGLGLSDVLLGAEHPDEFFDDIGVPNLRLLTAGTSPPNPTELLASPAMRSLHDSLLQDADLVIYDTPAVLAVADALEIGPLTDLAIIVGRVGVTTRRRVQSAITRLRQVGTDVSGTVLNGLGEQHDGYRDEYEAYTAADLRDPWNDSLRDEDLTARRRRRSSHVPAVHADARPRARQRAEPDDESLFSPMHGPHGGG